jgi:hypothetical protein
VDRSHKGIYEGTYKRINKDVILCMGLSMHIVTQGVCATLISPSCCGFHQYESVWASYEERKTFVPGHVLGNICSVGGDAWYHCFFSPVLKNLYSYTYTIHLGRVCRHHRLSGMHTQASEHGHCDVLTFYVCINLDATILLRNSTKEYGFEGGPHGNTWHGSC